jgi:hypothetical protein
MPPKKDQDEENRRRLKKIEQDNQARITAQDAAKRAEVEKKMEADAQEQIKIRDAKIAETARLKQLAAVMDHQLDQIVSQVVNLRQTQPNGNAGDNGIKGGTRNPLAFYSAALSQMKYQSNYDISFTTVAKFRIQKSGQSDILIHVTPDKKQ